jgi:hypothetical protein
MRIEIACRLRSLHEVLNEPPYCKQSIFARPARIFRLTASRRRLLKKSWRKLLACELQNPGRMGYGKCARMASWKLTPLRFVPLFQRPPEATVFPPIAVSFSLPLYNFGCSRRLRQFLCDSVFQYDSRCPGEKAVSPTANDPHRCVKSLFHVQVGREVDVFWIDCKIKSTVGESAKPVGTSSLAAAARA